MLAEYEVNFFAMLKLACSEEYLRSKRFNKLSGGAPSPRVASFGASSFRGTRNSGEDAPTVEENVKDKRKMSRECCGSFPWHLHFSLAFSSTGGAPSPLVLHVEPLHEKKKSRIITKMPRECLL
jgi:hypothetical protein